MMSNRTATIPEQHESGRPAAALAANRVPVRHALVWNLGLDELRKECQRLLPAEIARLGRNDAGHPFLHDAQLCADGYLPQGYRRLHLSRQARVIELVRVANALVARELDVRSAEGVTLAGCEVGERHLVGATYPGVLVVNLAGESVRWQPLGQRVRIEERSVDPLWRSSQHTVKPNGAGVFGGRRHDCLVLSSYAELPVTGIGL